MPEKYYHHGQACKCLNTNYVIQYAVKNFACFILNENRKTCRYVDLGIKYKTTIKDMIR